MDPITSSSSSIQSQPGLKPYPLAKTKKIMKSDPSTAIMSSEAVHIVNGLAGWFTTYLASASLSEASSSGQTRISYEHVSRAVASRPDLEFLKAIVPPTHSAQTLEQFF
ncbi:hypothetical protein ADUPG1_013848 [Aduncisulcus paluster]|uniref:Transcription factor CBF/NF-Y/archaeal histone domain-containing protein n=1 Tax=Aduncisulcus paluster TaxID=2918883 RepID=A0ABQ5K4G4_9EUKA|nr:hypothetical protein ADUPG1_013847 [Aduncisulcus paluster]GKT27461.1 hypothetical protein ADUPG1_013848 [Aduncisulcus paluster]